MRQRGPQVLAKNEKIARLKETLQLRRTETAIEMQYLGKQAQASGPRPCLIAWGILRGRLGVWMGFRPRYRAFRIRADARRLVLPGSSVAANVISTQATPPMRPVRAEAHSTSESVPGAARTVGVRRGEMRRRRLELRGRLQVSGLTRTADETEARGSRRAAVSESAGTRAPRTGGSHLPIPAPATPDSLLPNPRPLETAGVSAGGVRARALQRPTERERARAGLHPGPSLLPSLPVLPSLLPSLHPSLHPSPRPVCPSGARRAQARCVDCARLTQPVRVDPSESVSESQSRPVSGPVSESVSECVSG